MSQSRWAHRLVESGSVDQTLQLGEWLSAHLRPGDVIVLEGPLGSGKTVLVRGIVAGLGGDQSLVGSPTFGLAHEYPIGSGRRLVHVDCYRISSRDDLESIGWDSFAGAKDTITVVEWGSRISEALPEGSLLIDTGHLDEHSRVFEFNPAISNKSQDSGDMP